MKQAQVRVLVAEPYASASLLDQVAARSGTRIARLARWLWTGLRGSRRAAPAREAAR